MPETIDLKEFERTARMSGILSGVESDLLHETLLSWQSSPGDPYTLLESRDGKILAAFAIICRISGRESTYDLRYLVVDRDYRSTAGGKRILEMIDEDVLLKHNFAVIRIETSDRKIAGIGADILEAAGYICIGHIPGYYGEKDDYRYLVHAAYRNPPNFLKPMRTGGKSQPEEGA